MNKHDKKPHQKTLAKRLFLTIGCVFFTLVMFGCLFGTGLNLTALFPKSNLEIQKDSIKEGDLRDDVIKKMADAWHHGECKQRDGGIKDVFLFGAKEPNQADAVVVTSQLDAGKFRVVESTYADMDFLIQHSGLAKCLPAWILTPVASPSPVSN